MSTRSHVMLVALLMLVVCGAMAQAQVPPLLNYQGRVALNGTNFNGTGQFKFALGNTNLSVIYWHNSTSGLGAGDCGVVDRHPRPVLGPSRRHEPFEHGRAFTHGLHQLAGVAEDVV